MPGTGWPPTPALTCSTLGWVGTLPASSPLHPFFVARGWKERAGDGGTLARSIPAVFFGASPSWLHRTRSIRSPFPILADSHPW